MEHSIKVSSITNAQKGEKLLRLKGFSVHIERNAKPLDGEGCGYELVVRGDAEQAKQILKTAGIRMVTVQPLWDKP